MLKDVIEVRPLGGCRLYLHFEGDEAGEIDLSTFVRFDGVFGPLRDPERFAEVRAHAELGTICWPNGADLDPVSLYARVTGRPICVGTERL